MKSFNDYIKFKMNETDSNNDLMRIALENAKKNQEIMSAFLADLDGKYKIIKDYDFISDDTIKKIQKSIITCQRFSDLAKTTLAKTTI